MSMMKKTKEFFGLAPYETEQDEAYYGEEMRYEGSAAYAPDYREPEYGYARPQAPVATPPAPRVYQPTIVTEI